MNRSSQSTFLELGLTHHRIKVGEYAYNMCVGVGWGFRIPRVTLWRLGYIVDTLGHRVQSRTSRFPFLDLLPTTSQLDQLLVGAGTPRFMLMLNNHGRSCWSDDHAGDETLFV